MEYTTLSRVVKLYKSSTNCAIPVHTRVTIQKKEFYLNTRHLYLFFIYSYHAYYR